ncbi:hypothetical protein BCEN4_1270007 [Burkholderia cenocepacia]|nr:hypothetical protein BCEN4_1270007 [Burkholderia cenocepacia]
MRISRADLLQSPPFSEERCDGPSVSARLGELHQAAVRRFFAPAPLPERRSRHQSRNFLERRA